MIKRTTTIVTILVLMLGVAIVFAKASPRVARVQRAQGDVFALRNHVSVSENHDPTLVSYQRNSFAVNRVHQFVGSDVSGVARYGRVPVRHYVQNARLRYDVDNGLARRLVEKVEAKSVRVSRAVQLEMATVTRRSVDRGVFMKLVAVPRQLSDYVLLDQERLTGSVVNSPELVAVRGV